VSWYLTNKRFKKNQKQNCCPYLRVSRQLGHSFWWTWRHSRCRWLSWHSWRCHQTRWLKSLSPEQTKSEKLHRCSAQICHSSSFIMQCCLNVLLSTATVSITHSRKLNSTQLFSPVSRCALNQRRFGNEIGRRRRFFTIRAHSHKSVNQCNVCLSLDENWQWAATTGNCQESATTSQLLAGSMNSGKLNWTIEFSSVFWCALGFRHCVALLLHHSSCHPRSNSTAKVIFFPQRPSVGVIFCPLGKFCPMWNFATKLLWDKRSNLLPNLSVRCQNLECVVDLTFSYAAADIQEVRRHTAVQLYQVHCCHGKTSTVNCISPTETAITQHDIIIWLCDNRLVWHYVNVQCKTGYFRLKFESIIKSCESWEFKDNIFCNWNMV